MLIGVDLDEVLADNLPKVLKFHNERYGTNFRKEHYFSLKYWEVWGCSKEEAASRFNQFNDSPHMQTVAPVRGAVMAVEAMAKKHRLVIITARPASIRGQTIVWVEKHFPNRFSDIHFSAHFSERYGRQDKKSQICRRLKVDVVIEDSFEYAKECAERGTRAILFDRPWNRGVLPDNILRARSWPEIVSIVERFSF